MNRNYRDDKKDQKQTACRCNRCARCIEEARWERIFQEKFADPYYYGHHNTRTASPLVDI